MSGAVDYGNLSRRLRAARELTQERFAHLIGVSFATVNGWENGKHRPMPVLARMLEELARESGLELTPEQAEE